MPERCPQCDFDVSEGSCKNIYCSWTLQMSNDEIKLNKWRRLVEERLDKLEGKGCKCND